ncbi:MAG: hypothetical protein IT290_12735 [Deltaproteobacteria bacterium]|nr:hypothetical protein [Deltaproteobacteria bacterium]
MSFVEIENRLWKEIASIASDEGLMLYDLERVGGSILRVTADRPRGVERIAANGDVTEGEEPSTLRPGITSGECTRLCRRLMVYFLAEGPNFGLITEPEIEVSSPGINRTLRLKDHFVGAIGERVKVISREVRDATGKEVPSRFYVGELREVSDDQIALHDEQSRSDVQVPLGSIKRANVEYQFD